MLCGGLGNQLFGWAAGYSLSKKLEFELVLNTSQIELQKYQLGELLLGDHQINSASRPIMSSRRLSKFNPRVFVEKDFSHDAKFHNIADSKLLIGFFQSWKYFSTDIELIRELATKLVNPSKEFLILNELISENPPLIVHVRRGDYKEAANFHGLAKKDYYDKALDHIREASSDTNKTIVMSDEPHLAKKIVEGADLYIGPNDVKSPAENLILMSKAKHLIGANSTFSLWAGILMENIQGIRIFPEPWFKHNSLNSNDLVPPEFKRVEANL